MQQRYIHPIGSNTKTDKFDLHHKIKKYLR